jgi:hypothetical protein
MGFVVSDSVMHGAAVIPDYQVMPPPVVAVDILRLGAVLEEEVQDRLALARV